MKLYIFNPDSDMSLANNDENYMAPLSARRMAEDLALMPVWYAESGSAVLAASAYNIVYLEELKQQFMLPVEILTKPELTNYNDLEVIPWGWNRALRKDLFISGVSLSNIPSVEEMETIRGLSSRLFAKDILNTFANEEYCCGESVVLSDLSSCQSFVEVNSQCVLKAPWSGSGKGLSWCSGSFTKSISGWCNRMLKEQGSVMGEPVFNKVEDFAMEFWADGRGQVFFIGYSLFSTTSKGAYVGNILSSSEQIEAFLGEYIPFEKLIQLREKMKQALADTLSHSYYGYLGVDMMICKTNLSDTGYFIHPCLEINVRMNMGIVVHNLYKNFVVSGRGGRFVIEYYKSNDTLQEAHREAQKMFPLYIEHGRIASGYLSLVPVTPKSQYRAYIEVK